MLIEVGSKYRIKTMKVMYISTFKSSGYKLCPAEVPSAFSARH